MNRVLTRSMTSSVTERLKIVHDRKNFAFRALLNESEVGHLEYRLNGSGTNHIVDFNHTYTDPIAQGKGIAANMVKAGLVWARENKFRIIPSCSYVAAYIEKNPEWKSSL
jgi:predicted GNAT family acetyltransferase